MIGSLTASEKRGSAERIESNRVGDAWHTLASVCMIYYGGQRLAPLAVQMSHHWSHHHPHHQHYSCFRIIVYRLVWATAQGLVLFSMSATRSALLSLAFSNVAVEFRGHWVRFDIVSSIRVFLNPNIRKQASFVHTLILWIKLSIDTTFLKSFIQTFVTIYRLWSAPLLLLED